jgi:hypothetical protein
LCCSVCLGETNCLPCLRANSSASFMVLLCTRIFLPRFPFAVGFHRRLRLRADFSAVPYLSRCSGIFLPPFPSAVRFYRDRVSSLAGRSLCNLFHLAFVSHCSCCQSSANTARSSCRCQPSVAVLTLWPLEFKVLFSTSSLIISFKKNRCTTSEYGKMSGHFYTISPIQKRPYSEASCEQ